MKETTQRMGHHLLLITLLSLFSLLFVTVAKADPPTRVARLSYLNGSVSFSPAGQTQWMYATYNRPLTTNDRLWADANSRAELQLGAATLRINNNSALTVVNLDDNNAQFLLSQGTLNLRVWLIRLGQVYEIDTPTLSLIIRKPGDYRIDVQQNNTSISVRSGQGEIDGQSASYLIQAPQSCQFMSADISNYQCNGLGVPDDFDQWCFARNQQTKNSVSARYVSREVIGYQDLDDNGTWSYVAGLGNVWTPSNVPSGWAPYRYGQWVWIAPWGWTWVDNSPWGFAPYHYGRWAYTKNNWYWVPGGFDRRPVYAPALVVFIGNFQISIADGSNTIGWFPLAPGEAYIPTYRVSKNYFTDINVNNTTINNTYITQIYNKPPKNVVYQNKTIINAVSVIPQQDFFKSKAVKDVLLKVPNENILKAQIVPLATTPPAIDIKSVSTVPANVQPPEEAFTKPMLKFKQGKGQSFPKPVILEPKPLTSINVPVQPLRPPNQPSIKPLKPITQPPAGLVPLTQPAERIHPKHQALSPITPSSSGAPIPPPGAFGFGPSSPTPITKPSHLTPPTPPAETFHPKHKTLQSLSPPAGPSVAPIAPASSSPTTPSELTPPASAPQQQPRKHKEWSQTQPSQPPVNPPSFAPQPASQKAPAAAPIPAPVAPPPASFAPIAPPPPVRPAPAPAPTAPPPPQQMQMNFGGSHKQQFNFPAPQAPAAAAPLDDKKHKDKDKDKDNGQSPA